jgi:hypothetical protein
MQLTIVQRRRDRGAVLGLLVSLLGLAGCSSSVATRSAGSSGFGLAIAAAARPRAHAHAEADPATCVMQVPGTGIHVRDVEGGVAVMFDTVARERVPELRRAVEGLMRAYAAGRRASAEHEHSPRVMELARRYREAAGELPPLQAAVQEVDGGAELVVRAADPATVAVLRRKMRAEVAVMQRGVCPLVAAPSE